jgi:hypothetical protein
MDQDRKPHLTPALSALKGREGERLSDLAFIVGRSRRNF